MDPLEAIAANTKQLQQLASGEVDDLIAAIKAEVIRARAKFPAFNSAHEGYAVILEEMDEAWAEIKHGDSVKAKQEMVQVAAMAVRYLLDL